jgi:hypothetical protein
MIPGSERPVKNSQVGLYDAATRANYTLEVPVDRASTSSAMTKYAKLPTWADKSHASMLLWKRREEAAPS